jgi:hypothetical protein
LAISKKSPDESFQVGGPPLTRRYRRLAAGDYG